MTHKEFMAYLLEGRTFEHWYKHQEDRDQHDTIRLDRLSGNLVNEHDKLVPFPEDISHWRLMAEPIRVWIAIDTAGDVYAFKTERELDDLIKDREESYNPQISGTDCVRIQPR